MGLFLTNSFEAEWVQANLADQMILGQLTSRCLLGCVAACSFVSLAQSASPVAIVTAANHAHLIRNSETAIELSVGEILFPEDVILVDRETQQESAYERPTGVEVWHCVSNSRFRLESGAVASFDSKGISDRRGRISQISGLPFCPLPPLTLSDFQKRRFESSIKDQSMVTNRDQLPSADRMELDEDLSRIASGANGVAPWLRDAARAATLFNFGLVAEGARLYANLSGQIGAVWPEVMSSVEIVSSRGIVHPPAEEATPGQIYAVLVGINDYPEMPNQPLAFADRDAHMFYDYLRSPRGGSVPEENLLLLVNQEATAAAIRKGMEEFLPSRGGSNDTVIFFIGAHAGVGARDPANPYILAYDSTPENLPDTAIRMQEVRDLLDYSLPDAGNVLIFIDVCRAGRIGTFKNRLSHVSEFWGRYQSQEAFGILASDSNEEAWESSAYGNGHGAFSYFLLRGLNGDADRNQDGTIAANELYFYVSDMVREGTRERQHPRLTGDMPGERALPVNLNGPGIDLPGWSVPQQLQDRGTSRSATQPIAPFALPEDVAADQRVQLFLEALRDKHLLGPDPDSAQALFADLRVSLASNPTALARLEIQLSIALQDAGQQILLTYLAGEDQPQLQTDFQFGARLFEAASVLDPGALALRSRTWFCTARALLFDGSLDEALRLLERALQLEPNAPYLYNALGLLYLQQAAYDPAISAFHDAIQYAPHWAYPRHNLALSLTQVGRSDEAIEVYRAARLAAPDSWFIPYNLGLVEQRMNRLGDAEDSFREAMRLAPDRPEPETALGYLAAFLGHEAEAERHYQNVIQQDPTFAPARHNLAFLWAGHQRAAEAIALWEELLQEQPALLAPRLALASVLLEQSSPEEALAQYEQVLELDDLAVGARLAAARILLELGRAAEAEEQMRRVVDGNAQNAAAWEILGDARAAQGEDGARRAYERAADLSSRAEAGRISKKIKALPDIASQPN